MAKKRTTPDLQVLRDGLEEVVERHRQRCETQERHEAEEKLRRREDARVVESRQSEAQRERALAEEQEIYQPAEADIEQDDDTDPANDPRYIAVRTPEVEPLRSAGTTYMVRTGRTLVTHRLRRAGDEGLAFVEEQPRLPAPEQSPNAIAFDAYREATAGDEQRQVWSNGNSRPARHSIYTR